MLRSQWSLLKLQIQGDISISQIPYHKQQETDLQQGSQADAKTTPVVDLDTFVFKYTYVWIGWRTCVCVCRISMFLWLISCNTWSVSKHTPTYWSTSKTCLAIIKSSNAVLSEVVNDLVLTKQPDLLMIEVRVFFSWLVFAAKLFGDFRLWCK